MDAVFQEEEKALAKTERIIKTAATGLEREIAQLNQDIDHYVCVDYSDRQELAKLRAENKRKRERVKELRDYQKSPYFGRMDLDVEDEEDTEVVYIGKTAITVDFETLVIDWRSPIGQYFYMKSERKFHAGQIDYILQLRREFNIEDGKLVSYHTEFDGETVSLTGDVIDPFLLTVLKDKRRQNRLTDIIKTIQSNQNDIIRRPRTESFIVQGCAGSGKTMILLHRLSYLLFNYREISTDSIKIITPNSLFDAHINELSNELGLNRIERKSVDEYYVSLIKGFSRKMNVSSEVLSEKSLNVELLKKLYSEQYFSDTFAHYNSYWDEIIFKITELNIGDIAARLSEAFEIPIEHNYEAYSKLKSVLRLLASKISEKIKHQNELTARIEYFRNEEKNANEENERCKRNLDEIAKAVKSFIQESLIRQQQQVDQLNSTATDKKARISLLKQERQELEETRKSILKNISVVQDDILNLTDYHTVIKRTDGMATGLLSALSKQVEEISQLEIEIQKTAIYNFGKKSRLRTQLTDAIETFSEMARAYVTEYLSTRTLRVQRIDQRITELQQLINKEGQQLDLDKKDLTYGKRDLRVLLLCMELFSASPCPDLDSLDRNVYKSLPKELRIYDETFKQSVNAQRRLKNIRKELANFEAQYEAFAQMKLSGNDVNVVKHALELVAKLCLSEILNNIMMKDMIEAYHMYDEVYKRTNYHHKLYIRLLFCYLYYGKVTGNHGSFINIDEAQDISISEYRLMRLILGNKCIFNLYGDVNQLVYQYKGISDWREIAHEISDTVFTLNENYRNTLQITDFCNKEFGADIYPIGISGNEVCEQSLSDAVTWIRNEKKYAPQLRAAIIFRHGHTGIKSTLEQLVSEQDVSWFEISDDKVSILSVENAKGIEFDLVVAVVDGMTSNEKYISYTRALDSLYVVRDHYEYTKRDKDGKDEDFKGEISFEGDSDSETEITGTPIEFSVSHPKLEFDEDGKTIIPQVVSEKTNDELINAIFTIMKDAFGEDQILSAEQCQIVQLLGNKVNIACTAPSGWKKSIILFALAKYTHMKNGMQSVLTAEGHLQENELVLAEKLGLKAGIITENMQGFLADFKKEKYDVIFAPFDFFAYEENVQEFIHYFSGRLAYWGIDHPSEETILWPRIKETAIKLKVTSFLMSKNGFEGIDLTGFEVANIMNDAEPIENLIHAIAFADTSDKKTWIYEHANTELWGQGIIYCNSEEECKEVSKLLRKQTIKAEAYINVTAQKNIARINYLSNSFSKGGLPILVTTHDVGKNLSNPNIRFIIHYSVPEDRELYAIHISQIGKLAENPIVYDLRP